MTAERTYGLDFEVIAGGLWQEIAAAARAHRIMISITFAPYEQDDEETRDDS